MAPPLEFERLVTLAFQPIQWQKWLGDEGRCCFRSIHQDTWVGNTEAPGPREAQAP